MSDFQNSQMLADRNVTVFQDRRKQTDSEILIGLLHGLTERMDRFDDRLAKHMEEEAAQLKQTVQEVVTSSFPDGDHDGHRRAHEAWIRKEEDKAKFWETMKTKLAEWGLIGFAGWAFYYLWQAFLKGPK